MKETKRKSKYAILGNTPEQGQSKKAWILEIEKLQKIDPKYFFITTGEATIKIQVLIDVIKDLLKDVKKLQKVFIATKDESDYLETCWEDGNLILKKKEKRSRAKKEDPKKDIKKEDPKAKKAKKNEKSK
ncbi:MAG: hypothetical protein ACTSRA_21210 [Promethearchaeota archaeon]